MNRKIGKFKLWQLLAIGGALGFIIYEYEKGKEPGEEKQAEGLVASTNNPLAGSAGGGEGTFQTPPEPGPPGPSGEPGAPGAPGPTQFSERQVEDLESIIAAKNNPHSSSAKKNAPLASKFPQVNSKGEHYKTVKQHGKTVHVYKNGRKVVVGAKKKPAHHKNPLHKPSHAAPRAPVSHAKPTKPKVKTKPRAKAHR